MKTKNRKLIFVDWALMFALNLSIVLCLQRAYRMTIAAPIITWLLILTGVFCVIFHLHRSWIAAVSVLAVLLAAFFLFRRPLAESFGALFRLIVGSLSGSYLWVDQLFSVEMPTGVGDLSPAMLMLSAVMCYLTCASVAWLRALTPCVLWSVACISPCFFLTDLPMNVPMLVLFLATLLVLAFSQGVRNRAPEAAAKATLFAMLPAAVLVSVLLLLFPAAKYSEPPLNLTRLSEQFRRIGERADAEINVGGTSEQGVDLRKLGARQERSYTALTVTVDEQPDGWVYLRGTAYTSFDGDRWTLGPSTKRNNLSVLAGPWGSGEIATVKIHTTARHSVLFTPNNLVNPVTSYRPNNVLADYRVPNDDNLRDYSFSMYLSRDTYLGVSETMLRELREAAYDECLYLPGQTAESLRTLADRAGISGIDDPKAQIEAVIAYVQGCADYELSPPKCPENEDFSTWFLTAAKGGYCVHFASSAAAMLRSIGIPARFVEGYITRASAGQTVEVAEKQSHAWVEAWVEGEGWVRFDPTPAAGIEQTVLDAQERPDAEQTGESEETGESGEGNADSSTEPTQEATDKPDPDTPDKTPETERQPMPVWIWIAIGLAAAILTLWGIWALRRARRRSRYAGSSGNERALLDWRRCEALCRACKATPDESLYALALKARFSQHTLEPDEQTRLTDAVGRQEREIRKLPIPKRLWTFWRWP